jgi:bifunctional DNA-binding transcriptional regulator/antitoxin component of YhaV-PrlF toxin-antitoxin module
MKSVIANKLTTKCQATIPEKIRGILDLHPGDSVVFEIAKGKKEFYRF